MAGLALVVRIATHPSRGGAAGVVHRGAEVVGVADPDNTDAVFAGPGDGFAAGGVGEDLPDAGVTVEQQQRATVDEGLGCAAQRESCSTALCLPTWPPWTGWPAR
jgi:hypothetical protein